jgi:hypothetical protein
MLIDLLTGIHSSPCGGTKPFLQPVYNINTSGNHVSQSKTQRCFCSENVTIKNTAATGIEIIAGDASSTCVYTVAAA